MYHVMYNHTHVCRLVGVAAGGTRGLLVRQVPPSVNQVGSPRANARGHAGLALAYTIAY